MESKDEIFDCIQDNFLDSEGIITRAPFNSFVCDVYIDKENKLWIVDFNIFDESTKSLLFNWEELRSFSNVEARINEFAEFRLVSSSDDIIPNDAGISRGPIDAVNFIGKDLNAFKNIIKEQEAEDRNA